MSSRADISVFQQGRDQVGESPLWDPTRGCLWWVDVEGHRIHCAAVANGASETFAIPDAPGALALAEDGTLIVAAGLAWHHFDPAIRRLEKLASCGIQDSRMRFNDGIVDARGRFWTGTLHDEREPDGELFCLDATGVSS